VGTQPLGRDPQGTAGTERRASILRGEPMSDLSHEERAIILSKALEQLLLEVGDYHRQTDDYGQILEDYGYEAVHAN
tara:strand:+ start:245 stop:475 length:231 start_codon:yes stop_codon:yes gene_type:complete